MIIEIQQKTGASVRQICETLELSRSSFYHGASETPSQCSDRALGDVIEEIFHAHRKRYGYRRIHEELDGRGVVCTPDRVRRLMRQRKLRALQPRHFVPRTSDGKANKPSPNLISAQELPQEPNKVWAGDITYIPTESGWLYLAVVIDLCSRRILGWSLASHMRSEWVLDALNNALATRPKLDQTIFHSDRGSQYGSTAFRDALKGANMRQSMSARANPYQNAWTESFIATLKKEMLQGGCFEDSDDARTEIFEYIDGYYNNLRKHSALGYQTPHAFECQISTRN